MTQRAPTTPTVPELTDAIGAELKGLVDDFKETKGDLFHPRARDALRRIRDIGTMLRTIRERSEER